MLLTVEVHRHHCAWRILSCLGRPAQWHPSIEHLAAWSHSLVMCSLSLVKQEEGPTFIEQQPKTQHSVLEHAEIPWHVLRETKLAWCEDELISIMCTSRNYTAYRSTTE